MVNVNLFGRRTALVDAARIFLFFPKVIARANLRASPALITDGPKEAVHGRYRCAS